MTSLGLDPLNCQTSPRLPQDEIQRRSRRGITQQHCATCQRFRWAEEKCDRFVGDASVDEFYRRNK